MTAVPTLPQFDFHQKDTVGGKPAGGVCMHSVKIRLQPVDRTSSQDMVIGSQGNLPLFEGQEGESLVCPGCGEEVTRGVSAQTLHALFQPPERLLFHCDCDTYGAVAGENSAG
jgi:hypothetical protein